MVWGVLSRSVAAPQGGATWISVRSMSKYFSKAQTKRQPLNTKWAKKGYKKGKGCRSTGHLTSKGKFVFDKSKIIEYVVPDLTDFKLKPYVAKTVPRFQYPLARKALEQLEALEGA